MILRGQVPEDHLLFEAEIEKVTRKNRKSKTKENQEDNREYSSTSSSFSIDIFQENNNMAGRKHHLLEELLEITPYIKGLDTFLALQCLQLTGPWR